MADSYRNRGIVRYTDIQKAAYYARKAKSSETCDNEAKLERLFRKLTGWDNYDISEIRRNSIIFPDRTISVSDDCIRVIHRDFIRELDATTVFSNNVFSVNPGLDTTFPWLSSIANSFEKYRINGMVFQFKSTSSHVIDPRIPRLGQVILASDYSNVYMNRSRMMESTFSNSGKPSEDILHAIECTSDGLYRVRSGDIHNKTDIKTYDMCLFQLAIDNMSSNYPSMGQLWVSYDISFYNPVQNNRSKYNLKKK